MTDRLIVVRDHRASQRAFGGIPVVPNANGPDGTVAPAAVSGEVMTATPVPVGDVPLDPPPPPDAQRWAGWPESWRTPQWNGGADRQARVSTVYSCVRLNALAIGSMTPILSRGNRPVGPRDTPSWVANPQPELYAHMGEALQQVDMSLELTGDAYAYATSRYLDTDLPRTWMVLDPLRCTPRIEGGVRRVYLDGRDVTEDTLHLRYLTSPGRADGMGPLEGSAGNLVSAAALEQYGAALARQGGIPWGVIEVPGRLRTAQVAQVQDDWVTSRLRLDGAPAVVSGGAALKTLTLSPKDMALLDLRVFDEQRIAAAFGVAPFLVGLPQPEGLTYANTTSLRDDHYRGTLRPTASNIALSLASWALDPGYTLALNASEYTQGTVAERVTTYLPLTTTLDETGAPILTGAEFRALVGLPPRTGTPDLINQLTTGTQ